MKENFEVALYTILILASIIGIGEIIIKQLGF